MANSTLLSLFQSTLQGMGVATYGMPSTVIGNTNQDVVQTLALTNMACDDLGREFDWQAMTVEYRFTTQFLTTTGTWTTSAATVTAIPSTAALSAGTWQAVNTSIPTDTFILSVDSATQVTLTQTPSAAGTAASITFSQLKYTLPADYDRKISRTDWDKTKHWQILGPKTAQEWQWLKSGYISVGPRMRFRLLGNFFQVWPPPTTNEYCGFEYVSKFWCLATAGTAPTKKAFSVDTDTTVFPDSLITALIRYKYFQVKGFDTGELREEYEKQKSIAKANDADAQTLNFAPRIADVLITQQNIPDTGYGS